MRTEVPPLDAIRRLSDVELADLRLVLVDQLHRIRSDIETAGDAPDPEWLARARGAQRIHERGLSNIRSVQDAREAANADTFGLLLRRMSAHVAELVAAVDRVVALDAALAVGQIDGITFDLAFADLKSTAARWHALNQTQPNTEEPCPV